MRFQRREDGSVDFTRGWQEYKWGFGDVAGEHWLGNEVIAAITRLSQHSLRVDLQPTETKTHLYSEYNTFSLASESEEYRLDIDEYQKESTAGDGFIHIFPYFLVHKGKSFSTFDRDTDKLRAVNCAADYRGGWWMSQCFHSFLNGQFGSNFWNSMRTNKVATCTMKIKPIQPL